MDGETNAYLARQVGTEQVIPDGMLPGQDDWSVCARPRGVIGCARRRAEPGAGLELYAADDRIEPFAFSGLLARLRTILRRGTVGKQATTLAVADLEIDAERRTAVQTPK